MDRPSAQESDRLGVALELPSPSRRTRGGRHHIATIDATIDTREDALRRRRHTVAVGSRS
jgi:hypothetical protein